MNWDLFVAGALIGGSVCGAVVCVSSVMLASVRERGFWVRQAEVIVFPSTNPERN